MSWVVASTVESVPATVLGGAVEGRVVEENSSNDGAVAVCTVTVTVDSSVREVESVTRTRTG